MCGIAGVVDIDGLPPESKRNVETMMSRLRHRGPDDSGIHEDPGHRAVLGHRRLTILDLTDAGHQPLSRDGRHWLTYNGEVYNFRELRAELDRGGQSRPFRSSGDTEVVAAAWERWGAEALDRLRGMFAFAVWDESEHRLVLARDAIGIKPLYWAPYGGGIAFASEIKALTALPSIDLEIDGSAIDDYLTYGYIPHPKTAYRRIRELAPGSLMFVDRSGIRTETWWRPATVDGVHDAASALLATLRSGVASQLVSDVPIGVLLSSGFDSSAVAALASEASPGLLTFTMDIGDGDRSEAAAARHFAGLIGSEHREESVRSEIGRAQIEDVVDTWDQPFADSSALPTGDVCRLARRHVKVAIAGDGGDELFGGYDRHHKWLRLGRFDRVPSSATAGRALSSALPRASRVWRAARLLALRDADRYAALAGLFGPDLKRRIAGPALAQDAEEDAAWAIRRHWHDDLDPLSRCTWADLRTYLPDDILTKVDRASMRASLEVRPPLLDTPVVELVTSVPAEARFRVGDQKPLLRDALAGTLPAEVFERRKRGFSLPLTDWLGERSGELVAELRDGPACREGFLRADRIDELARPPFRGDHLWAALVLDAWLRRQ
jgi:asparagine synthase (glutamine-hydrolysing)